MIKEFKDYTGDITEECDVCVIGSGAGGAVVAKEISEKGFNVVLLEEGGNHPQKKLNSKPLDSLTKMWRDGGLTGTLGKVPISVTLGKGIGGTTAVNSATCFRTPDKILKFWRDKFNLTNMSPEVMNPYFEKVEKEINATELSWDVLGNSAKIIKRGAEKLGYKCTPLKHNVKDCKGHGTCQFGCPEQAKQSTDVSYIPKAVKNGARIYANCKAEKLIKKNGAVHGVKGFLVNPDKDDKKTYKIEVKAKFVVLSAGTMLSPQFLMKNGIKGKHVGRHLQIHPAGRVTALMKEEVKGWRGVSQGAMITDFENEDIILEGIFVHPSLLLAAMPGVGKEHKDLAKNFSRIAAFGTMIHDSTEGRVYKWRPFNQIVAKYNLRKVDMEKFKKAIAYTSRIFFAGGAEKVFTGISTMPIINSIEEIDTFLKTKIKPIHMEILAFHPLGTCRMAREEKDGVVNREGETFKMKNLYVADGSIVPTSLGVNPQVTIMSLATKISDGIINKLNNEK